MGKYAVRAFGALLVFLSLGWSAAAAEKLDELAEDGERYMQAGSYAQAIKIYEKIMENPTYANILAVKFDLAWAYYLTGAFAKAIPLFSDLSGVRGPEATRPQSLFLLGDSLARLAASQDEKNAERKKNIAKALELQTEFQTKHPRSPNLSQSLYSRGYAYFLNKQYAQAETDLQNLIRTYPQTSAGQDAHYLLATVYSQQGLESIQAGRKNEAKPFLDKARGIFSKLTELQGNPITANDSMFSLAETFFGAGLYDEAIRTFREVRSKDEVLRILQRQADKVQTEFAAQHGRGEDTTFVKREQDRLKAQRMAVEEGQDLVVASYLRIAQAYFEAGGYDVCRAICAHLLAFATGESKQQANYLLVNTYLEEEDPDNAARELEDFQQTFGADAPIADTASLAIGQLYLRQGTEAALKKALFQLTKSVEEYPEGQAVTNALHLKFSAEYVLALHQEACATIDTYLEKYPKGPAVPFALYYKAMAMAELNQMDEALKTIDQVIRQFPQKTETFDAVDEVFYQKGDLLMRAKKPQEAASHFEAFLARFKDSKLQPEAMYQLGVALNAAGKTDKAKQVLENLARQYPQHKIAPTALYQIAVVYFDKKDWPRMTDALELLIESFPRHELATDGFYWLGTIARQDGRLDDAIDFYSRCVESSPAYQHASEALLNIGVSYRDKADKMGLPAVLSDERRALFRATLLDAAYAFEDLLAGYPASDQAQEGILEMGRAIFDLVRYKEITEEAGDQFFAQALARHKNNANLLAQLSFARGNFLLRNKQTEKALAAFKQSFTVDPQVRLSPEMLASYAEALKDANQPSEAETIYKKIIADFPDNPHALAPAWYGLADISFRQNDFKAAEPAFERVLKEFPWYEPGKQGKVKLAEIYELKKDYAQAEKMFTEVWKQEKGAARIGAMLGVARCQLAQVQATPKPDNWQELIRVCSENLTKVIVLYGEAYPEYCSEAYFLQGQACELVGDSAKAKEMYYKVTTDYKNFPAASRAAARLQALGGYTPPTPESKK